MPTTIQNVIPVQRATPPQPKPIAPLRNRRDDFQQHLVDAAADEAAPAAEKPAKSANAESKKSAGNAKTKVDRTAGVEDPGDASEDVTDPAVAEAGEEGAVLEAEAGGEAAEVESEHHDVDDGNDDGDSTEGAGAAPAAATDPAVAAQLASAVQPVSPNPGDPHKATDEQQESEQHSPETDGAAPARRPKLALDSRVHPLKKDGPDASEQDDSGETPGDATAAPADALLNAPGGEDGASSDGDAGQQPGGPGATGMKKAAEAKAAAAELTIQPTETDPKSEKQAATAKADAPLDPAAAAAAAQQASAIGAEGSSDGKGSKTVEATPDASKGLTLDASAAGQSQGTQAGAAHRAADPPAPRPPEVQFADTNHEPIVTGVKAQLLPHGGSMQIRLDPPELGALKVMVEMRDGAMTATFQTSNEEATRLLSHSLNQLKHVLEGQGVSVERLQVQQAPKGDSPSNGGGGDDANKQQNSQNWQDEHAARQEQQRKEVLRRMWRRVSGVADPVDVTA